MTTARLVSDELMLPDTSLQGQPATDSSRVLLGLMSLARQAEAASAGGDLLGGVISKSLLRSLMSALHARDVSTLRHARRVAMLAVGMAQYLGWEGRQQKLLEVAALLHDVGKIGVPDNILFKPGKLSPEESELMGLHYQIGVDVLQACRIAPEVIDIVAQSQATQNGTRSEFLGGGELHLGARILAVADAYDSLSTDQVYRDGKPHDEILKILMDGAGTKFDGNVVCALSRWIESEGLPFNRSGGEEGTAESAPAPALSDGAFEAATLTQIFSYLYVLESLYDGFYLVDADLRYVVWNFGAQRFLGHEAAQMLGQTWSRRTLNYANQVGDLFDDRDCPLNRAIASGKPTIPTLRIQSAEGDWLEVELQAVPLLDAQGRLQGVAEIFRDLNRNAHRPHEYRELKLAASRDPLTGVANRGELESQLGRMLADYDQHPEAEPFSVLFLDVDYFKNINDTHGHAVGDQVLINVARLLQHEAHAGEVVARYGGEEFIILCPATELQQAVRRAERLRVAMPQTAVEDIQDLSMTVSFGATQVEAGDSLESILRRADKALYLAKQSGRNRTCSVTSETADSAAAPGSDVKQADNPFVFQDTFPACIAADMVVYKLGGFVNDSRAKLVTVAPKRAVLRVGSRGLLPFWGDCDDRRPVEVTIEFGNSATGGVKRAAVGEVDVDVTIRPIGWVRNRDAFQNRARHVLRHLRSYFAAN